MKCLEMDNSKFHLNGSSQSNLSTKLVEKFISSW